MSRKTLAGILLLLVGVGLLAGAGWSYASTHRFLARAAEATGTVVKLAVRHHTERGRRRTSHHPVVGFETARGVHIEFESHFGSDPPAYRVGDRVPVLYDPADPREATIRTFLSLWLVTLILAWVGLILAGIGAVLIATGRGGSPG
jgi:hypothetical protein